MLYQTYQAQADGMAPLRCIAEAAGAFLSRPVVDGVDGPLSRRLAALCQLIARAGLSHKRPAFGIATVRVGNEEVEVREEAVHSTAFGTLLHFRKDVAAAQPRVLLVAPLSGHFATLLRDTVRTMLADHDVYITDWHNARDVSLQRGRFDFDDFIAHLISFLEIIGPGCHLLAICQPCVAALAAAALMAEDDNPAQPPSITLMAGPIDTRINPTRVNDFAASRSIDWFERHLIGVVPQGFGGALRHVYPGFVQLSAFMNMNMERHVKSFRDLFDNIVKRDAEKVEPVLRFYEEYFAVMDLAAEFYLETVQRVFQEHDLARGALAWRGRPVNARAIRRSHLLTVEGDRDDICALGQTLAAQDLCSRLLSYKKRHHVQPGVGHYGVFSGRRWNAQIYPVVRDTIHVSA
jgi:poly(3-hydroxybutyrate) depolymerase